MGKEKKGKPVSGSQMKQKDPRQVSKRQFEDLGIYAGIFLLAVAVRVFYLVDASDFPTFRSPIIDSDTYLTMAQDFAKTKVLTHEFFWQPFFYPLFLSLLSLKNPAPLMTVRVCQILISGLTCVLTYLLGKSLFNKKVGIIAGLIVSLYGTLIFYDCEILSVSWDVFWAVALLNLFIKAERENKKILFFLLGLSGGLSILTRPTFLPFFVFGCLWLLIRMIMNPEQKKKIPPSLFSILAGALIILLPVCFLNRKVTGKFGFLPYSGGMNFYIGNNENYDRTLTTRPGYEWDKLTALPLQKGITNPWEEQEFFYQKTREFIKNKPLLFLKLLGRKTVQFFSSREIPRNIDIYLYRKWSLALNVLVWKIHGFGFPFGILLPLAIIGWITSRRNIPMTFMLFLVLYSLSIILVFVSSRYRAPVIPALAVLASGGILHLLDVIREKKWKTLVLFSIGSFIIILFSSIPGPFCEEKVNFEAEMYYALAHRANEKGNAEEAINYYTRALAINPALDDAHNNLGAALVQTGSLDNAISLFEHILKKNPDREDVHNNFGMALVKKEQYDAAILHYQKALALNPHFTEAYYNLANALRVLGRNKEAMENYRLAIRTKPDYTQAHYNLGNLYASINELDHAAAEYLRALEIEPHNPQAGTNLGNTYLLQNKLEDAEKMFRNVLTYNPDFAHALFGLGNLFYERKEYEKASEQFQKTLRINPRFGQAYFKLGNIMQIQGNDLEAVEYYKKAIEYQPGWDKPGAYLAWLLATTENEKIADAKGAVALAQNLCEKTDYEKPEFLDILAAAHARAGQYKEAANAVKKALDLAKKNGNTKLIENIFRRMILYQSGKPFVSSCHEFPIAP